MQATRFDRYGCNVGDKRLTYDTLKRDWRCAKCGGRIVRHWKPQLDYYAACGRCASWDFIHENELMRQQAEAQEVLAGLPAELAAALTKGD